MPWMQTNLIGRIARARIQTWKKDADGLYLRDIMGRHTPEVVVGDAEIVAVWMHKEQHVEVPRFMVRFRDSGRLEQASQEELTVGH